MQVGAGAGLSRGTHDAYRDVGLDEVIAAQINTQSGVLAHRFGHSVQVLILCEVGHGHLVVNVPHTLRSRSR